MKNYTERQAELRFQKDNLEYAKAHREVLDWEKKLAEEKKKHTSLQEIGEEKQERKDKLAFQLLLKEWMKTNKVLRSLSQQIATLEQNSGLEEVNQRMDEIKKEAKANGRRLISPFKKMVQAVFWLSKVLKEKRNGAVSSRINKKQKILPSLLLKLISSIRKCMTLIRRKISSFKNLATV